MQAHWAGLFPDKTIPEFEKDGYKKYNRYWNDDRDMYTKKLTFEKAPWFYIKRYNAHKYTDYKVKPRSKYFKMPGSGE